MDKKIEKPARKKIRKRELASALQRPSLMIRRIQVERERVGMPLRIKSNAEDLEKRENILKINPCLRSLNSNDIHIKKIKKSPKEELKGYITPIFFFQTLIYLIKIVWIQIIITALPHSPSFQLLLMSATEVCYASFTIYCFINFFKYQTVIGFVARIGQSLVLALIYHQFYAIFLLQREGGFTFEHQERTIKYIIFGGFFEYAMMALRLGILCFEGCLSKFCKKG